MSVEVKSIALQAGLVANTAYWKSGVTCRSSTEETSTWAVRDPITIVPMPVICHVCTAAAVAAPYAVTVRIERSFA